MSDEYFDSPVKDKNEKKSKKEEEDESDETKISKIKYSIKLTLSPELWKDYFNILNKIKINGRENREEINLLKINFLQECFGFLARIDDDWERVNSVLKNTINDILKKLIVDSQIPFCWEKRLREINGKNINEVEVFNEFKDKVKSLGIIKKLTEAEAKNNFLHGNIPTLTDFALFAFLNQFFEFPLNIPEFKELFTPEKLSNEEKELIAKRKGETENSIKINGNLFKNYIKRVKNSLGKFGDDEVWRIMKQRPWPLNFKLIEEEENEIFGDKYEGPFNIEVGELTNIHTLLDINNAENFLSDESSQLKKELKKKGWWSDSEFSLNNNKIEEGTEAGPSEKLKGKEISTEETNSIHAVPITENREFWFFVGRIPDVHVNYQQIYKKQKRQKK
uniref:GST C-terminal domain-containing protein n=1 Tax=Meloidogyne incognita TaxID=6306 RepID=A0A914KM25_MELIC